MSLNCKILEGLICAHLLVQHGITRHSAENYYINYMHTVQETHAHNEVTGYNTTTLRQDQQCTAYQTINASF